MSEVLAIEGVTKTFPGVIANEDVDFVLNEGEIHCLLGENGAGKSTLMNVVFGPESLNTVWYVFTHHGVLHRARLQCARDSSTSSTRRGS